MSGPPQRMTATRFFGGLLMAAGGLIAVSAGLCSVVVSIMALTETSSTAEMITSGLPLVLLFGGVPVAIGLTLFFVGRGLYRERPPGGQPGTP
jgi:hypothetical protein